jgi:hypothetical protein
VRTDTERLDWLRNHYGRFVHSVSTGRATGGWDVRTTIGFREFDNLDWCDDGWRERTFPGDFRAAIDAAMDAAVRPATGEDK